MGSKKLLLETMMSPRITASERIDILCTSVLAVVIAQLECCSHTHYPWESQTEISPQPIGHLSSLFQSGAINGAANGISLYPAVYKTRHGKSCVRHLTYFSIQIVY